MGLISFTGIIIDYSRENYKNILVTALGFLFITMIFTVTITSQEGIKANYINAKLQTIEDFPFVISREKSGTVNGMNSSFLELENMLQNVAQTYDLNQNVVVQHCNTVSIPVSWINNPIYVGLAIQYGGMVFDSSIKEQIQHSANFKGRFPQNGNESIYVVTEDPNSIDYYNTTLGFHMSIGINTYSNFSYISTTIVGIYYINTIKNPAETSFENLVADQFLLKIPILLNTATVLSDMSAFYSKMLNVTALNEYVYYTEKSQFMFHYPQEIDYKSFDVVSTKIENFFHSLEYWANYAIWQLISPEGTYVLANYPSFLEFSEIRTELVSSEITSFVTMLPSFTITIFFASYTANIFFDRRVSQIGLLRIRGAGRLQLIIVLLTEGVLSIIVSIIAGYYLGCSLTSITVKSTEFLRFTYSPERVDTSVGSANAILLWSLAITVPIVIGRIRRLSRIDVIEARTPITKKPIWRRYYFDLVMLAIGIVGNYYFFYMVFNPDVLWLAGSFYIILVVLGLIFLPFPFFLLFGGLMTLSRLVEPIARQVSRLLWHKVGNLFSYSLSNVIRSPQSAGRTILLISLIFSILWGCFTVPICINTHNYRTSYYAAGAQVQFKNIWNTTLEEMDFAQDPNIADYVRTGTFEFMPGYSRSTKYFIVFPRFLEVAYFENAFGSIEGVKKLLALNNTALINSRGLHSLKLKIGDNVTYPGFNFDNNVTMINTFEYWPQLVTTPYSDYVSTYEGTRLAISYNTFVNLRNGGYVYESRVIKGYYFKLAPDANITAVKEKYGVKNLVFADELMGEKQNYLLFNILWMQLNVMFVITAISVILTIILYGYRQLRERARELSVERALGMTTFQLTREFIYDTAVLLAFGYVFGTILGIFFSACLSSILIMASSSFLTFDAVRVLPPPIIFFPWVEINVVIFTIIICGLLSGIIPALVSRHQNISKALKVA